MLKNDAPVESLHGPYYTLRAEVIPEGEKDLAEDEYLVHCCHRKPDDSSVSLFGDPIWIRMRKGERLRDLKKRIQSKLEIPDEEFSTWRFAYHPRQMQPLADLSADDDIISKFPTVPTGSENSKKYVGDNASFVVLIHHAPARQRRCLYPQGA